ncbi:MAG: hypothetical protein M0033_05675 [Nitrospiraceae bacterium]|nr:hypothetical protein [Nitrospiraceae bacterium]
MKKTGFFLVLIASFFVLSLAQRSEAVPSYARQLKTSCTTCHTIWPNLNQYGRQFKVKAYTDASPDWGVISKDKLNLFYVFPISARIMFMPYQIEQDPTGSPPGAGSPGYGNGGYNANSTEIDNMQLFIAGRIYKYAGVFTSIESGSVPNGDTSGNFNLAVAKVAFAYPLSEGNTLGAVLFWGLPTAADPFNSFGGWDRDIATPDDETLPWVLTKGWTGSFWSGSNYGAVVHGYFLGNRLYAAIGATRSGDVADADLLSGDFMHSLPGTPFKTAEGVTANPFGGYVRTAWDQELSNGAVTFGGAVYTGQENVLANDGVSIVSTHVNRQYIDASLEQNYGADHLVEAKAIYGFGQESGLAPFATLPNGSGVTGLGPGDKRSFNGGAIEADYFYQRTYGIVGQYNWVTSSKVQAADFDPATSQHTWLVGLNYLPWLNTKIQFIYANIKSNYATGGTVSTGSETDKLYKVMVDVAF